MPLDESMAQTRLRLLKQQHWSRIKRLTLALLLVWITVTFVAIYFSRSLEFVFLGWPFNYWMVAQGSLIVYFHITVIYAWQARRLDKRFGLEEVDR
jgi:putative solute:sodium symporter small subunit